MTISTSSGEDNIYFRKTLLIALAMLLIIYSVGMVCAEDMNNATLSNEKTVPITDNLSDSIQSIEKEDILKSEIDEVQVSQSDADEDILGEDYKTFYELQNQINAAEAGSTLKISGYYKGTGSAITISKDITIVGEYNDTVLDADGKSSIFKITGHSDGNGKYVSYNVAFKNLILKNGLKASSSGFPEGEGGAIDGYYFNDDHYQTAYNCIVINCKSKNGGAFNEFNAVDCIFINNLAQYGGAIYEGSATNCEFINNQAQYGGAIYEGSATNSVFSNNKATSSGGAIYGVGGYTINKCTFNNNEAANNGGAIYGNVQTTIKSSKFNNNKAANANDIYSGTAIDCVFAKSSNSVNGTKLVKSAKPKITIKQSGKYFGSKTIKVKVIDTNNNNKLLSGVKVTLKFSNGKTAEITTNSKGTATYNMAFNPKTYKVTASYNKASATLKKVKIVKAPAKITAKKVSTYYGDKYFKVKAINTKTKKAVNGAKILLKVYTGKKFKKVYIKTNSKGIAKYGGADLKAGKHKIIVKSASKGMKAKAKSSKMTILKAPGKIVLDKLNISQGAKKDFTVKVVNGKSKKGISGVKLLLKVYTGSKFQKVYLTTDSKGTAKYNVAKLGVGNHKIAVSSTTPAVKVKAKSSMVTVNKVKIGTYIVNPKQIVTEYVYNAGSITGFKTKFVVYEEKTKSILSDAHIDIYVNSQLLHKNVTSGTTVVISPTTCAVTVIYDGNSDYESSINVFEFHN